jgi:hypothetical protein
MSYQQQPGQYAHSTTPYAAPPSQGPGGAGFLDIRFTRFLSLSLISVWYVLALVVIAIGTVVGVIAGFLRMGNDEAGLGLLTVLGSLVGGLVLVVLTRLSLEGIAVLFRIANNTSEIAAAHRRP